MAISLGQAGNLVLPGLREKFAEEYAKWPGKKVWSSSLTLADLPDDLSYDQIADLKETGELSQFAASSVAKEKDIINVTFDYDSKLWTAQYTNKPGPKVTESGF